MPSVTEAKRPTTMVPMSGHSMEASVEGEEEIDLLELFFVLVENLKFIIFVCLFFALISGVYTRFFVMSKYEATAKLYVLNSSDSAVNLADLQIGSYLATDYQEVFKTWELHEMVRTSLQLPYTYEQLQAMLKVSNPANTRILSITIASTSPQEAMDMANEYTALAKKFISETMATEQPNVLSAALLPNKKASPNMTMNVFLGGLLGALLMIAILVIRFMMDDKLRSAEDILRHTGLPTLAVVPKQSNDKAVSRSKRG